jgi:processive 1,2-diacylglycerol beta-glucosyltransferase
LRVLCLTAEVGFGHTAAARAVARALELEVGRPVEVLDSYRFAAAPIAQVATRGYARFLHLFPQVYRRLRRPAEWLVGVGPFRRWAGRYAAANLLRHLCGRIPDAVVCTHPFACGLMAQFKAAYAPRLQITAVLTDFAVHPFWLHPLIDRYVVAHHAMKSYLVAHGVEDLAVDVSGIPIDERFGDVVTPFRAREMRQELALPLNRYVVMVMGGGLGVGPLAKVLDELAKLRLPLFVVIVTGRNERYKAYLKFHSRSLSIPVKVIGFIENVHEYMQVSDLLMTKPGGLSCAEVLAAQIPTILTTPLPGPEESNAEYLQSHGAALYARSLHEVSELVVTALMNPAARARLAQGMRRIAHPKAAGTIASRVLALDESASLAPVLQGEER